jgi:hypothetical protein
MKIIDKLKKLFCCHYKRLISLHIHPNQGFFNYAITCINCGRSIECEDTVEITYVPDLSQSKDGYKELWFSKNH